MNDKHFERFLAARTGLVHTDDRGHLVVPTVALVSGVLQAINAPCPEMVPLTTLSHRPERWSGCPVTYGHPQKDGHQISANDPRVLEALGFGTIANPRVEGKKLLMDCVLDPARAAKIGASHLIDKIRSGGICEVSVGAHVVTTPTSGVHQGRRYEATWQSLSPDHLAFVSRGACDVANDGCGAGRAAGFDKRDEDTPPDSYAIAIEKRTGLKPPCPRDDPQYRPHGQPPDSYQIAIERQKKQGEEQ